MSWSWITAGTTGELIDGRLGMWTSRSGSRILLAMQLGFFMMPLHPPGSDYTQGLDNDLEQILTVDLDLTKADPDMPDSEVTPEYLVDNVWIVGSPDDVTEKLQQLHNDVGGFGALLAMDHEWDPKEEWLHSMKLLKEEVLPRLP